MPFLFPETIAQKALDSSMWVGTDNVKASLKAFNFYCQKYLGLGYIASFIPGTEAFQIRRILSGEITQLSSIIEVLMVTSTFDNYPYGYLWRKELMLSLQGITGMALGLPLRMIMQIRVPYQLSLRNNQSSVKELISYFPLLNNIYYVSMGDAKLRSNIIANLIHTLCNPVRLIAGFLFFLNRVIDRVMEIGLETHAKPGIIRASLKRLVGIIFTAISIPIQIVMRVADIPYQILKNIIYAPLKFLGLSLIQVFKNEHCILAKKEDCNAFNKLPKQVWQHDSGLLIDPKCYTVSPGCEIVPVSLSPIYYLLKISSAEDAYKMQTGLDIVHNNPFGKSKKTEPYSTSSDTTAITRSLGSPSRSPSPSVDLEEDLVDNDNEVAVAFLTQENANSPAGSVSRNGLYQSNNQNRLAATTSDAAQPNNTSKDTKSRGLSAGFSDADAIP